MLSRLLNEEVRQSKSAAAGLLAQMKEMEQKAVDAERQLKEQGAKCRELSCLRNKLEELQSMTQSQEQIVAQSRKEAQQSQAELASLEAILTLLHLREVESLLFYMFSCAR